MIPFGYFVGVPLGYHEEKNLNDTKHIIGEKKKTPTYRVSIPFLEMPLEIPTNYCPLNHKNLIKWDHLLHYCPLKL
jgi:hypothetical protein